MGGNSQAIAEKLTTVVKLAIGTTSSITNRTARASALLFYDRIISGASVKDAFEAGRVTIEAMQARQVTSQLYAAIGVRPEEVWLYHVPRLIAKFYEDNYSARNDNYNVEFGVAGFPSNTCQIVFFSDETSDADEDEVCTVVRGTAVQGALWDEENYEPVYGDYRVYACGITRSGKTFTVTSTLCQALETYFKLHRDKVPPEAVDAIAQLRGRDGGLMPSIEAIKMGKKHSKHKKKGKGE